jgi:hypothetical protein
MRLDTAQKPPFGQRYNVCYTCLHACLPASTASEGSSLAAPRLHHGPADPHLGAFARTFMSRCSCVRNSVSSLVSSVRILGIRRRMKPRTLYVSLQGTGCTGETLLIYQHRKLLSRYWRLDATMNEAALSTLNIADYPQTCCTLDPQWLFCCPHVATGFLSCAARRSALERVKFWGMIDRAPKH